MKSCIRHMLFQKSAAVLVWLVLAAGSAHAQDITMDIQPQVIRLNEAATLKLTFINLQPPQSPTIPEIPGFDVQYTGQEQQFHIINGEQERRMTFNYRLQPRGTGKFQLGPFTMGISGRNIDFPAINIEVLPATSGAGANGETIDDLVFAKIQLPRTEVYLQERFDVELALYFRGVQLDRGLQLQNMPSTGLNLDNFEELGASRETVNNEIYEVRRFRLRGTALTAGTFELAPMVRVNVLVRRERSRDPFFGGFDSFFGIHDSQPLSVPVEPRNVVIRPLPSEGKPADFGGAVGNFNMEMDVKPLEVDAGDPVTLTLRITGRGNFETISMPPLNLGQDFRRYDPKLVGSGNDFKVFEQVFIPRSDSIHELPPVTFSFFDPDAGTYKTIVRGPQPLSVKAGTSVSAPQMVQAPSAVAVDQKEPLGIDIIDLKRSVQEWSVVHVPKLNPVSIAAHTTPALAILLLFAFKKRRESINQDITRRRRTIAPKSARASIRKAEHALKNKNYSAFHEAIWQAMSDYIAHRSNLEPGEVSPGLIIGKLERSGLAAEKLDQLKQIMTSSEEARFARGISEEDPELLQKQLLTMQDILRDCERLRLS